MGGQTFSLQLNKIPALAHGGFTQGVSIAGEAGTEAVISFMPTVRSENINTWQQAGRMLGVNQQQAAAVVGAVQPAASASSVVVIPAAVQSLMQQYAGATQGEALAFADRQVEMATADPCPCLTGDGGNLAPTRSRRTATTDRTAPRKPVAAATGTAAPFTSTRHSSSSKGAPAARMWRPPTRWAWPSSAA